MAHSAQLFLLLFLEPLLVCGDRSESLGLNDATGMGKGERDLEPPHSHSLVEPGREARPEGQNALDLPHSHGLMEPSHETRAGVELPHSRSLMEPSHETRADEDLLRSHSLMEPSHEAHAGEGQRNLELPHPRSHLEPSPETRADEGQKALDPRHSHSLVQPSFETHAGEGARTVDQSHSHSLTEPSRKTHADEGQKSSEPPHSHSLVEPSYETQADGDLPHSHSLLEPSPETLADEGHKGLDPFHSQSFAEPSFETRADERARTVEPPLSRSLLEPSNQTRAGESRGPLDAGHSHSLLEPSYETQADEGESDLDPPNTHSLLEPRFAPRTAADDGAGDLVPLHSRSMLEARDKEKRAREGANTSVGVSWDLFGKGKDPEYEDIVQGQLGDCYYLAGLAAMARVHPEVIKDAFVSEGVSGSGKKVFQLRFLVNGFPSKVSVDEVVPMACHKQKIGKASEDDFHFACVRPNTKTVWPILLEKGFAKIFGSYLAIKNGFGFVTFKALSQAPVDIWGPTWFDDDTHRWEEPGKLWDAMKNAIDDEFPITAGSVENNFGTAEGHAFAVIGVEEDEVKVYNPWASHTYNGKLKKKNDKSKGEYYLTWKEFLKAFDIVDIARIRKGYSIVSYKKMPAGKPAAFSIEVKKKKHFAVQLEWPTSRFVEVYGCSLEIDRVKLLIKKEDEDGYWHADEEERYRASNLHLDQPEEGVERKETHEEEPPEDKDDEADPDCNWFVGEKVLYKPEGHKDKVCSEIKHIDKDKNKVSVQFFLNVIQEVACKSKRLKEVTQCDFHEDDSVLYKGEKAQIVEVNCGKVRVKLESDKTKTVKCGEDSEKHLAYPKDCPFYKSEEVDVWSSDKGEWVFSKVTRVKGDEVSVKGIHDKTWDRTLDCDNEKELKKLSRCDKKSIKQLKRFQNLDNYDKMIQGDEDALFPPSLESIGPKGADCGDPAQENGAQPCEEFNNWGKISKLLGKADV